MGDTIKLNRSRTMAHWIKENEPSLDLFDENCKKDLNYDLHILKHGESIRIDEYEITAINNYERAKYNR